ncbi:MAG: PilZ domain-containing protein [Acidobacteria bacterium]|nr:PilZ domain-containing protein [Acidobacteriota bacterium]
MKKEQRGHRRIPLRIPARISGIGSNRRKFSHSVFLENASTRGAYFQLPLELDIGSEMVVTVTPPIEEGKGAAELKFKAEVARKEKITGKLFGYGLEFRERFKLTEMRR